MQLISRKSTFFKNGLGWEVEDEMMNQSSAVVVAEIKSFRMRNKELELPTMPCPMRSPVR
jgi:hypothetical protein